MNCVCGCSVFDHAKRQMFMVSEYDGGIKIPHHGPSFTLSGTCLRCVTWALSGAGNGLVCSGFQRPAKYASALRHLAETPMRLLVLADEAMKPAEEIPHGPYPLVDPTKWKNFAPLDRGIDARRWWKKYDRPPEPGRTETM